jgi:hypothetical protein
MMKKKTSREGTQLKRTEAGGQMDASKKLLMSMGKIWYSKVGGIQQLLSLVAKMICCFLVYYFVLRRYLHVHVPNEDGWCC